ncbi:MAG: dephospho-CoA kinase [Anaerolineaceae bacterium]|nr:dephospho-CoA kinase [Anaerolineaceae bacterium]
MSSWADKYVIGLTGNIGAGKSVVRRMLEHLGAYGIDADALGHRAIAKGAPGYDPVVRTFGRWVLGPDEQINRAKLGRVVFSDPEAMAQLEGIVHPLVEQAVDILVRRSRQRVVVIEAIKLLEAGLARSCDSIWVAYTPQEIQLARLMQNRGMAESEARQRIAAQSPQEEKISSAHIVIRNVSTFADTWRQVMKAWRRVVPEAEESGETPGAEAQDGRLNVLRGKPRHSRQIAELINRVGRAERPVNQEDVMNAFGEKAFLLVQVGSRLMGLLGWQVENLVSRTTDVLLDPSLPVEEALPALVSEMEAASSDLQCEASLLFVYPELSRHEQLWKRLGYEPRRPNQLGVLAWEEAATESMPKGTQLLFKQLRQDRILRPI